MLDQIALAITVAGAILGILPKLLGRRREPFGRASRTTDRETAAEVSRKAVLRTLRKGSENSALRRELGAPQSSGWVLATFAIISVLFAVVAIWRYRSQVLALGDRLFLAGALLLMMVAGMFVQVLSSNFNNDRPLLAILPSQLLYPLLFSPIVFYPIWIVGNSHGVQVFSFYAAFLNGYFWQSVVAAAKRPTGS